MQDMQRDLANEDSGHAQRSKFWPIRVLTVLLFGQGLGLLAIGFFYYYVADFPVSLVILKFPLILNDALVNMALFWGMAFIALIATVAFIAMWRNGWVLALFLQGSILVVALTLYAAGDRLFSYGMMLTTIFMVIYLHTPDVETAFRTQEPLSMSEEPYE